MPDDDSIEIEVAPVDPDSVYAKYLKTCAMLGVESARVRKFAHADLVTEWNEVLSGRPDPTTH